MQTLVAAVQFEPLILNVDHNLAVATQLAYMAAAKGAKVVVLPELCISGYVLRSDKEALQCAQPRRGYQTLAMGEISKQMKCHIVFGYVELYDGLLYNSAAVVGPDGTLVGHTQKHNIYGSDNLWAKDSEVLSPVIITPAGRLGILICRDGMNSYRESYRFYKNDHKFYRKGSIDTLALLTNWGESFGYPDSAWVELVEELDANVIVSNRVGKERDVKYKGGSCIISREKQIYTFGSSFTHQAIVGGLVTL